MRKGLKGVLILILALTLAVPLVACKDDSATTRVSYDVTYHMNYGEAEPYVVKVKAGTRTSAYKATRAGYTLKGWFKEAACKNAFAFTDYINADVDLYALWERDADKVTVTFDFNYTGAREPAVISVDSGKPIASADIPFCPRLGMRFDGWYKDAACTSAWDMSADKVAGHITLYAKYAPDETVQRDEEDNIIYENVTVGVYASDLGYVNDLAKLASAFNKEHEGEIEIQVSSTAASENYATMRFTQTPGANKEYASLVPAEDVYAFAGIEYSADDWYKDATRDAYIDGVLYTVPVIAAVPCLIYNKQLMDVYNGDKALPSTFTEYKTLLDTVYAAEVENNPDFIKMVTATNWSFMETTSYATFFQNGADYYTYNNGNYVNKWGDEESSSFADAVTAVENFYSILGGDNAERRPWDEYHDDVTISKVADGSAFMGIVSMATSAGTIGGKDGIGIQPISGLFADSGKMYKDSIPVQPIGFQFCKANGSATELAAAALFADYVSKHSDAFVESGWYPLRKEVAVSSVINGNAADSAAVRAMQKFGNPENFRVHDGYTDEKTVFYNVGWDHLFTMMEEFEFTHEDAEVFTATVKEYILGVLKGVTL